MDREKVVKGLEGMIDYFFDIYRNSTDSYKCAKAQEYSDCAIDAIALLKEQEWIHVTERVPADGSDILVYYDDGEESRIVACNYDNGVWFDCVLNTLMVSKNITHWMPLPKPPKKEGR